MPPKGGCHPERNATQSILGLEPTKRGLLTRLGLRTRLFWSLPPFALGQRKSRFQSRAITRATMPITIPNARALFAFSVTFSPQRLLVVVGTHPSLVLRPADDGVRPTQALHNLRASFCFQLHQQLLDAIFFFKCCQALFHVVRGDLGLRVTQSLAVRNLVFHAVEGGGA